MQKERIFSETWRCAKKYAKDYENETNRQAFMTQYHTIEKMGLTEEYLAWLERHREREPIAD